MRNRIFWWLTGLLLFAAGARGQSTYYYDERISELNQKEEQLQQEYARTLGMKKFEIEQQIESVRKERAEVERQRVEALAAPPGGYAMPAPPTPPAVIEPPLLQLESETPPQSFIQRLFGKYAAPRTNAPPPAPPPPDWKTVEQPQVVVKGVFKTGGRYSALVSGGQIVYAGDVFSTRYRGSNLFWRVTEIGPEGAQFEPTAPEP